MSVCWFGTCFCCYYFCTCRLEWEKKNLEREAIIGNKLKVYKTKEINIHTGNLHKIIVDFYIDFVPKFPIYRVSQNVTYSSCNEHLYTNKDLLFNQKTLKLSHTYSHFIAIAILIASVTRIIESLSKLKDVKHKT